MQSWIPWEQISWGWRYIPNGGDVTDFPAPWGLAWNLFAVTGTEIRYEPLPHLQHVCLAIDPAEGGGYLILEDITCTISIGPRHWESNADS